MNITRLKSILRGADQATTKRIGRYELEREIGRGGMAVVYEASDPQLGRRVALKVLHEPDRNRLRREAEAAARLRHPNIVAVHEVTDDFIAMDLVEGRTLAEAARDLPLVERVRALEGVARAVAYAHDQGILHRDLKPTNILVDKDGRVVLTDFGLAKLVGKNDLTLTAAVLGTPHYMAPEQILGRGVGRAADIWSLGIMLHELVSGRRPFEGESVAGVHDGILHGVPAPLRGSLGAIAARALERQPERRYPTAHAFADDLTRWLGGRSLVGARLRAWVRSRWWRAIAVGAVVAAAAALALVFVMRARRASPERLESLLRQGGELMSDAHDRMRWGHSPLDTFAAAEQDFRLALAADPRSEEALNGAASVRRYRAQWLVDRNRDPGADCAPGEEDRPGAPDSQRLRVARAWRLLMCGRWAERQGRHGRPDLEAALALLAPETDRWYVGSRGLALALLGRFDESEREFERAAANNREDTPWFLVLWIEARTLAGDHAGSAKAIARAGVIAERNAGALMVRGRAHLAAGRWAEARADLQKAIAFDATLSPALRPDLERAMHQGTIHKASREAVAPARRTR